VPFRAALLDSCQSPEQHERSGISNGVDATPQDCFVARVIRQSSELAMQPPAHRRKPENGAVDQSEVKNKDVSMSHVREFMREDGTQGVERPCRPRCWQDDYRTQYAECDRGRHKRTLDDPWTTPNSKAPTDALNRTVQTDSRDGLAASP
jgi:hypothetical protein